MEEKVKISIDGKEMTLSRGQTVLQAAGAAGINIPALCYMKNETPSTSCMVCLVEDEKGNFFPACSTPVEEGMRIKTASPGVRALRKKALELLLREHRGDCEGPCTLVCPAKGDVPGMMESLRTGNREEAYHRIRENLLFPATLGEECRAPCERGCRRGDMAIRGLHYELGLMRLEDRIKGRPFFETAGTRGTFLLLGGGLYSLALAHELTREGFEVRICDPEPGEDSPGELFSREKELLFRDNRRLSLEKEEILPGDIPVLCHRYEGVIGEARFFSSGDFTSPSNLFIFSESLPEKNFLVKALAHAREEARKILGKKVRSFHCRMGALLPGEREEFFKGALSRETSRTLEEEAARCFQCQCLKLEECDLRRYAAEYEVGPVKQKSPVLFKRYWDHERVVFEPGKCIRCGKCVILSEKYKEEMGFGFAGRGYGMRVEPAGGHLKEALRQREDEYVFHCPTGALRFKSAERGRG